MARRVGFLRPGAMGVSIAARVGLARLDRLHPDLRAIFGFVPNPPVRTHLGRAAMRWATRTLRLQSRMSGVRTTRVALRHGAGVEVVRPGDRGTAAALFYIHGGGMVIGAPAQDHLLAAELARELGIVVVLADYRLAPEHPYPTPIDDCEHGWLWLHESTSSLGVDPERIALGGQSAGGGLAAMLAHRLRDRGGVQPAALWLFCPMLDDRTAADRSLDALRHPVWNNRSNRVGWRSFLGVEPGSPGVPAAAVPARGADLSGLPPMWIGTGTADLFHAEDRAYGQALADAGVAVTVDEVAGAPHGFEIAARFAPVAGDYVRRSRAWLAGRLGIPGNRDPAG